jgi:tRNA(Ile)-lysidine synthase
MHGLESRIYKMLKESMAPGPKRWLLAVSGGCDSMALVAVCCHLKSLLNLEFGVCHIHHGSCEVQKSQMIYRDEAEQLVAAFCEKNKIIFYSNRKSHFWPKDPLRSEEDFRNFRRQFLFQIKEENNYEWIVTGHHQLDFVETQLLKLIRGCNLDSLKRFRFQEGPFLRPLLMESKKDLSDYLENANIKYINDPTNQETNFFRNWIRHNWLNELEDRNPGSLNGLTRSFHNLQNESTENWQSVIVKTGEQILLTEFWSLTKKNKLAVLSKILNQRGVCGYSMGQLNEVLKRLDTNKKQHTFKLLKLNWVVDGETIHLRNC